MNPLVTKQLVVLAHRALRQTRPREPGLRDMVRATHLSARNIKALTAELGIVLAGQALPHQRELHTMPYRDYLLTPEWLDRRELALQRALYRCQVCNRARGELNVHHRTYVNRGYEQPEDLVVLCRPCHARFHLRDASQRN